jgi:tRNA(Ile)-lysidine synthase
MLEKVKKTVSDNHLMEPHDRVLVALSGGPDSVALLHVLSRLRSPMKLELLALYVNHRIRPRAAKREEVFCAALCKRLKVRFETVSEDIPSLARRQKRGVEETARDFRYEIFDKIAARDHFDKIATGHHLDDRVETILFRILRGTGRSGLAGMPVRRGRIIRPLFEVRRAEIMSYLKRHRLKFCIDQSNLESHYRRNYMRNKLLVEIRQNLNPAVDKALLNLSETASEEDTFLNGVVRKRLRAIVHRTAGGKIELDLGKLSAYDTWLRRRILRHCLAESSPREQTPDRMVVDRLDRLCVSRTGAVSLPGGLQANVVGDRMVVWRRPQLRYAVNLDVGESCSLAVPDIEIRSRVLAYREQEIRRERRATAVLVDYHKVQAPLTVRSIRPGDRFGPLGLGGTKKIGDYLTDCKIDRIYRDEIPVVCDRQGVIWLVGLEIADRVKIDSNTKKVLRLELQRHGKARTKTV